MSNSTGIVEIRTPWGSAWLRGGFEVQAESVRVSIAVNQHTQISVTNHTPSNGERAIEVLDTSVTQWIGGLQKKMFTIRPSTDATISLADGKGKTLTTSGYITAPGYVLNDAMAAASHSAVGQSALLSNLRTDVYQSTIPNTKSTGQDPQNHWDDTDLFETSIAGWMQEILKRLINRWKYSPTYGSTLDQTVAQVVHYANWAALQAFNRLCEVSKASTQIPEMQVLSQEKHAAIRKSICSMFANAFLQSGDDFFQVLLGICNQFQLLYVPTMDGYGRLITGEYVNTPMGSKVLDAKEIQLQAGTRAMLPVQQVLITGMPGLSCQVVGSQPEPGSVAANNAIPQSVPAGVVIFPEKGWTGGAIISRPAPAWLPNSLTSGVSSATTISGNDPNLYITDYINGRKSLAATIVTGKETDVRQIMLRHAKNVYVDQALAGATAQLELPLDLDWEVGQTYIVKGLSGGKPVNLFQGFLASATHFINGGSRPSCGTSLQFTHVQCDPFRLKL
jgi:hypothetical protein